MSHPTPNPSQWGPSLFSSDSLNAARKWIFSSSGFAVSAIIGIATGYLSTTMNLFIVGSGLLGVIRVVTWSSRFRHHIHRSDQVLRLCSSLSVQEILDHEEVDDPIVLRVIQAIAIKMLRGRGTDHRCILTVLERSLLSELHPMALTAKTLPAMGLVGTCFGMIGVINAIGDGAVNASDTEALTQAVGNALPSMGIAISTTLAAAFIGSVLLSGLVSVATQKVTLFVDELDAQLDLFPFPKNEGESDA